MTIARETIAARGLEFSVRRAGSRGDPVLLLHGFPECSAMWEPVMASLAADGYRCAAPDQRGYSAGARPEPIGAYRYEELVADVFGLADALGWNRFHLVAHDWGAIVAWMAAAGSPHRLTSLTVLSIPHPHAFATASWADPETAAYRRLLELILAPDGAGERVLGRDRMAAFRKEWTSHSPEEIAETVDLLAQPGAMAGALAWYRASDAHRRTLDHPATSVTVPTLFIAGLHDPTVRAMAIALGERIATADYRRVDIDAGHWLVQEKRDAVIAAIKTQLVRHALSGAKS